MLLYIYIYIYRHNSTNWVEIIFSISYSLSRHDSYRVHAGVGGGVNAPYVTQRGMISGEGRLGRGRKDSNVARTYASAAAAAVLVAHENRPTTLRAAYVVRQSGYTVVRRKRSKIGTRYGGRHVMTVFSVANYSTRILYNNTGDDSYLRIRSNP